MLIGFFLSLSLFFSSVQLTNTPIKEPAKQVDFPAFASGFYRSLNDTTLNFEAFYIALRGFYNLSASGKLYNNSVLSIIDYSKSANLPRFYMLDMHNRALIYKTIVSHGRNSGKEFARDFSNELHSFKSSLGFFITSETYFGKHGYSLRLEGIEDDINHNSRIRDIVIHGAEYVDECLIKKQGYIGRSLGCPALPVKHTESIIERIKECSCLFAYFPDANYLKKSQVINSNDYLLFFDKPEIAPALFIKE